MVTTLILKNEGGVVLHRRPEMRYIRSMRQAVC